ncbi:MAG: 4-hydroxy-3-methylbut-2-enyl diphosphate reductase [Acidimicrobiia bacterium]|nr:MAG: 4-hydroxy-3-methylbut-2-enyl diphosphate reductase [Acidimicrobiia bacterium]
MAAMPDRLILAEPRGFCAGVEMAIKALTWMVRIFEPPIYCYHQIVHNEWVVAAFERVGVVFVDDISQVPEGAPVMLSAHGSAPQVVEEASRRAAVVIDAVCPLVTKVHHEVRRLAERGYDIVYVGHRGHDEAVGTVAEAPHAITLVEPETGLGDFQPKDPDKVALVAQTTLGMYEWEEVLRSAKEAFPGLWTARKSDLCYATTNRQSAVAKLAELCDLILVVGSDNSSNTQALVRVARERGVEAHRIDSAAEIQPRWLEEASVVGLTAGASAPDHLVAEVIERVAPRFGFEVLSVTSEGEYFPLPPQLRGFVTVLQAVVEAGLTARPPTEPGWLDRDREWTAAKALEMIGT